MSGGLSERVNEIGRLSRVRDLRAQVDELAPAVEEDAILHRSLRGQVLELERTVMGHVAHAVTAREESD